MSDLGLISYRAYWKDILLYYLCNYPEKEISVKAISEEMGEFAKHKFMKKKKGNTLKLLQGSKRTTLSPPCSTWE